MGEVDIGETIKSNIDYWKNLYFEEKEKNKKHKIRIRNLEEKIIQQKEQIAGLRGKYHNDPWLMNDYIDKEELIKLLGLEDGDDTTSKGILDYIAIIISECNRLEDIEDKKVQVDYERVFNKGVASVENKIKAKLEEVSNGIYDAKIVLQSFLKE